MTALQPVLDSIATYGAANPTEELALGDAVNATFTTFKTAHPHVPAPLFVIGGASYDNGDPTGLETRAGVKYGTRRTYHGSTVAGVVKVILANIKAGRKVSHVSMKVADADWASAAKGGFDAWAKDVSTQIQAAIKGTGHVVRLAINHEPENNGGGAAQRDAWKGMQARLSKFFDVPGIQFVVVLMGYHQLSVNSSLYALWNLDACVPLDASIKGVGYDLYEKYGSKGSTKWTNFDGYFAQIQLWHAKHHKAWGLSETGVTSAAFTQDPQWFAKQEARIKKFGGSWFDYFNTSQNSVAAWQMEVGGAREKGFIAALKAA